MKSRSVTNFLLAAILIVLAAGGFTWWRSTWAPEDKACWNPLASRGTVASCKLKFWSDRENERVELINPVL
jgi:hypothetical protein